MKLSAERGGGKAASHLADRRLAWLRRLYPQISPDPAQFLFFLTAKPRRESNRELQMSFCKQKTNKTEKKQGMSEGSK